MIHTDITGDIPFEYMAILVLEVFKDGLAFLYELRFKLGVGFTRGVPVHGVS